MNKKISQKELLAFLRVFSLLLSANVLLNDALRIIITQGKNRKLTNVLKALQKDVAKGDSLSGAMAKHTKVFPEILVANVRVAEETGKLAEVLVDFTEYQEKFFELKRRIIQALRYPAIILIITFLVLVFMLFFLIPSFGSVFANMNTEMPELTRFLMDISRFFTDNGFYLSLVFIILIFVFLQLGKSKFIRENYIDIYLLKAPVLGDVFRYNLISRFALSMSTLLKGKVQINDAVIISGEISKNSVFKRELKLLNKKIIKGESFSKNIKNTIIFDQTFLQLVSAGEESAELDNVFNIISEYYTKEFDYRIETLTGLLEPILMIVIGLIVSVVLVAMYMPMFELVNFMGV